MTNRFRYFTFITLLLFIMCGATSAQNNSQMFEEGVRLYWGYRLDDAAAHFDEAIAQDPALAEAYAYRGATRTRLSNLTQARADFERAVELAPDSSIVLALRARFHLDKDPSQALADTQAALMLEPDSALGLFMRGTVYKEQENYTEATHDFDAALEATIGIPDYAYTQFLAAVYVVRGDVLVAQEFYEAALADYDLAAAFGLDEPILYVMRGLAYNDLERFVTAHDQFELALERDPNYAPALEELTRFYSNREEHETSLEYNLRWVESEPSAKSYTFLSYTLGEFDRTDEALEAAQIAIRLNPEHQSAWINSGYYKSVQGDLQGAMLDYIRVRELDMTNALAVTNGGWILSDHYAIQLSDIAAPNIAWVANTSNGPFAMNDEGLFVTEGDCGPMTHNVLFAAAHAFNASLPSSTVFETKLALVENVLFFEDSQTAGRELARIKDGLRCISSQSGLSGRQQGVLEDVTVDFAHEGFVAYKEEYMLGGLSLSVIGHFIYFRYHNVVILVGLTGTGDLILDPGMKQSDVIIGYGRLAMSKLPNAPIFFP